MVACIQGRLIQVIRLEEYIAKVGCRANKFAQVRYAGLRFASTERMWRFNLASSKRSD